MAVRSNISYGFIIEGNKLENIKKGKLYSVYDTIKDFSYGKELFSSTDCGEWENSDDLEGKYDEHFAFSVPYKWVSASRFGIVTFNEGIPQSIKDEFKEAFSKFLTEFRLKYPNEANILEEASSNLQVIVYITSEY